MEEERTPLTDQEKIRLKRIAKLSQSTPTSSTSSTPTTPTPVAKPIIKSTPTPTPIPSTSSTTVTPNKPKGITIHAAGTSALLSSSTSIIAGKFPQSFQVWEDEVISNILKVTLSKDKAESSNWSITYLKEVSLEILEEEPMIEKPIKLTTDLVDRLLLSKLSLSPSSIDSTEDPEMITVLAALPVGETLFEYLSGCWKRERAERYKLLARKGTDSVELAKRIESMNKIKSLLVSYIGLILIDPTMFPQDHVKSKHIGPAELSPLLLPSSQTFPPSSLQPSELPTLLYDLSIRYTPSAANDFESGFSSIINPPLNLGGFNLVVNQLDVAGGGKSSGINARDYLNALQNLVEIKGVPLGMVEWKNWDVTVGNQREIKATEIEISTTLGPYLRLSTFPDAFPTIAETYFPSPSDMQRGDIESASSSLRGSLRGVQISQFQILNTIVRAGPVCRESVLSYFGNVAKANVKRAAMRVDPGTTSSHGFVINLHIALLNFATPFMDSTYSKIDKIDPLYYKNSSRINIAEETKMSATQTESDAYYAAVPGAIPTPPNFISEIFFLCCLYLHIGPMHTIKEHKGITQQLSHMKRQLDDMMADTTWRGTPNEAAVQAQIDKFKKRRELYKSELHAYEVQLLDPEYLTRTVGFINFVMAWLVRMVDPAKKHPQVQVSLPMPEETPEVFRMLPEYLIEDITEFLSFVSKYASNVLAETPQNELMTFMLVFLSTPYMKNPYLKGQFVEIMYYLTRPTRESSRGSLGDVLNFHPLALKNLMPCLVHAYVQIEITGSHTQFYDKFNTRYYITQLFKLVWTNPTHREALKLESLQLDRYVRFANLLMNDTTYLLDDAVMHLGKVVGIQKEMDDKATWDAKPLAERQEQEKLLRQYEGSVRSDLDLGHESLRLLKLFTSETKEPFLTPEIVDRLAAMLDMNLNMLAGPRCQDLKVREPEKYKFYPKELLSDVLQIYLELGTRIEFQEAVAKDGRSYSMDLFERADRIARKTAIKTDDELSVIKKMVIAVEVIKATEEEDDAMGEVPEEFLDPLTYDIMRDPVLLPSSKTIVDRSTIKQHYLSDASDPFNRVPLKWEDIVDAVELREQILEFLAERRRNRKSTVAATEDSLMDVDKSGTADDMLAPKERCPVCSSKRWSRDRASGSYVCEEGHLLQGYVQESTESQDVSRHFSFKRDVKGKKRKRKIKPPSNDHFHGDRATFLLYQCMQWVLRENLRVMVEELGYPEELESIVRDLWGMLVASSGIGFTPGDYEKGEERSGSYSGPREGARYTFGRRKKKRKKEEGEEESEDDEESLESESEKEQRESEDDSDDSIDVVDGEQEIREKAKRDKERETEVTRPPIPSASAVTQDDEVPSDTPLPADINPYILSKPKRPPKSKKLSTDPRDTPKMSFLLVLLYLGCVTLRLPIFLSDIIKLAENYQILYLDAKKNLPLELQEHLGISSSYLLNPTTVSQIGSSNGPEVWLSRLVRMYQVDWDVLFPDPNLPLLTWRITRSLALSPLIYSFTQRLLAVLPSISFIATASKSILSFSSSTATSKDMWSIKRIDLPEAILAAGICIVVRELWDSEAEILEREEARMPAGELWVKAMEEIMEIEKKSSPSLLWSKEIVSMTGEEIDAYLDFCEENLLSETKSLPRMLDINQHFPAPAKSKASILNSTPTTIERINSIISDLYSFSHETKTGSSINSSVVSYNQLVDYAATFIGHTSTDLHSLISELDSFLLVRETQMNPDRVNRKQAEAKARRERSLDWKKELERRRGLNRDRKGAELEVEIARRGRNRVAEIAKKAKLQSDQLSQEEVEDVEMEE